MDATIPMISTPLALVTIHTPCALIIVHKPKRQFPTIGPLTLFFARRHGVHADLLLLIVVGCAFLKLSESRLLLLILRVGLMVTKVRFLEASRICVHIYITVVIFCQFLRPKHGISAFLIGTTTIHQCYNCATARTKAAHFDSILPIIDIVAQLNGNTFQVGIRIRTWRWVKYHTVRRLPIKSYSRLRICLVTPSRLFQMGLNLTSFIPSCHTGATCDNSHKWGLQKSIQRIEWSRTSTAQHHGETQVRTPSLSDQRPYLALVELFTFQATEVLTDHWHLLPLFRHSWHSLLWGGSRLHWCILSVSLSSQEDIYVDSPFFFWTYKRYTQEVFPPLTRESGEWRCSEICLGVGPPLTSLCWCYGASRLCARIYIRYSAWREVFLCSETIIVGVDFHDSDSPEEASGYIHFVAVACWVSRLVHQESLFYPLRIRSYPVVRFCHPLPKIDSADSRLKARKRQASWTSRITNVL